MVNFASFASHDEAEMISTLTTCLLIVSCVTYMECMCGERGNCSEAEPLKYRFECQNSSSGCDRCPPLHVGNPSDGRKCIPCRVYCNGHSEVCLSEEQVNSTKGIDLSGNILPSALQAPLENAVCLNCQHNTRGARCDECKIGYFIAGTSIADGCRECNCNGHGHICDPVTGTGCLCSNNTESDRLCIGKLRKKTATPCWQLQCNKCKEYYLGNPTAGHQCYRQMFLDKEYCFDSEMDHNCGDGPHGLLYGRTILFAVQPRYMNVDIRILIEVTEGVVDFYLSFKDDTFKITSDPATGIHQVWLDPSYNKNSGNKNQEKWLEMAILEANKSSSTLFNQSHLPNLFSAQTIETLSSDTDDEGSFFVIKQHLAKPLTTYLKLTDPTEWFIVRRLRRRLLITIPQQVHDLRSTRFFMVLKGLAPMSHGYLLFRQDQSRIDLFVFFSVFFSCFFLFLSSCILIWKVKQIMDIRRARRLHAVEIRNMASRPFSSVLVHLDPIFDIDKYEYALSSPSKIVFASPNKPKRRNSVKAKSKESLIKENNDDVNSSMPRSGQHLVRPVAVELTCNGRAAVVTVLVVLPGNRNTPVRMSFASALVFLHGSNQDLLCHDFNQEEIVGFRNVMKPGLSGFTISYY